MSLPPFPSSDGAFLYGKDGKTAWFGLIYVQGQLIKRVDKAIRAEHDLPLSWFEVILRLAGEDNFVSISSIVETVSLSSSRVSRVVEGLERHGLIKRRQGEYDARVSEIALSEAGIAFYKAADATHRRVVNEYFLAKLSAAEAEVIAQVWRRLLGEPGVGKPGTES